MKKLTLVAGAVLALVSTTSALAQSSVTLYGIVDAAFVYTTKQSAPVPAGAPAGTQRGVSVGATSAIDAGQLATSRWGMRGSEDLGGGLKANFTLESGIGNDTGASGGLFGGGTSAGTNASLFERGATVGVSGGFGAVTLGRQNTLAVDAVGSVDPIGFSQPGINPNVSISALNNPVANGFGTNGGGSALRQNNSIRYALPTMSGFSGAAMYGFGEQAGNRSNSTYLGLVGGFNAGPVTASLGYNVLKNATNTDKLTLVGGGVKYEINNAFAVKATFAQSKTALAPSNKTSVVGLGVDFVAMPGLTLTGAFYNTKRAASGTITEAKANQLVAKVNYALSKRTSVYTLLTNERVGLITQPVSERVGLITNASDSKSANRMTIGLFHAF